LRARRLIIRRFRAFDHEAIIDLSSFTVVTGPNNLGKSTVLLALKVFFTFFDFGRPTAWIRSYKPENDYPKKYVGKPGRRWPTVISVIFELSESERQAIRGEASAQVPIEVKVTVSFEPSKRPTVSSDLPPDQSNRLSALIRETVKYVYIPATRGIEGYRSDISNEISNLAFGQVANTRSRLRSIQRLVDDAKRQLESVEVELAKELRRFMPNIKGISFEVRPPDIGRLLQLSEINVDDGANTSISMKGDGVKSLFAIAVFQYVASKDPAKTIILGIEEPEAHLHASGVYALKPALRSISSKFQVVVTTHSPILIQRDDIGSNVIVDQANDGSFTSMARRAKNLAEIRASLGIKPQDNMTTAEVVIVVEGQTEEEICPVLLSKHSAKTRRIIESGRVKVLSASSASKVASVVRALARDAANCVVLLDNDSEGRTAKTDLLHSGLIEPKNIFLVPNRDGCDETEFEDMFEPELYASQVASVCGCQFTAEEFKEARKLSGGRRTACAKWSDVMDKLLQQRGKDWQDLKVDVRRAFAGAIRVEHSRINLGELICLKDMASTIVAMLKEEDEL
jgi:putative ATP-dependent endonuclease of OLD family